MLKSGGRWKDMPRHYPPYQTCHRRYQQWCRDGTMEAGLHALAGELRRRGELDLAECYADATFAAAKKGATKSVVRRKAKAPR